MTLTLPAKKLKAYDHSQTQLSVLHLLSAAMFCRCLASLEDENRGKDFGPFWEDILAYSTGTVLTAVASLEAYVNDVFVNHASSFSSSHSQLIIQLWNVYERKPVLEKSELALTLKGIPVFNRGESLFQNVQILIELRNRITHFRPEWDNVPVDHARMSKMLRSRLTPSSFFPKSEPLFPRGWASHSTAVWAVSSVHEYLLEFEKRMQLLPRISIFHDKFNNL